MKRKTEGRGRSEWRRWKMTSLAKFKRIEILSLGLTRGLQCLACSFLHLLIRRCSRVLLLFWCVYYMILLTFDRAFSHTRLRSVAGSVFVPTESPHIASMWETPGSGVPEPCKKLYKNKKDFDLRICSRAFQVGVCVRTILDLMYNSMFVVALVKYVEYRLSILYHTCD